MIKITNHKNFKRPGWCPEKSFSQVAKKVLLGENKRTEIISLALVDKGEMRKLNKKFRKKDKATDVLSFNIDEKDYLGEIIICPEVAIENARKYGVPEKEEMMKIFVHGILHLCGYEHEKGKKQAEIMESKEKFYLIGQKHA
jgi:probable rRNA maturation factor